MKIERQQDGTILISASDEGAWFERKVQSVTGPVDADSRPYRPGSTGARRFSDIPVNESGAGTYDPRDPQSSGGSDGSLRDRQKSAAARQQYLQEMVQKTRKENPG